MHNYQAYEPDPLHPLSQNGYLKSDWIVSNKSLDLLTSRFKRLTYRDHFARRKLIEHDHEMLSWPITHEILGNADIKSFLFSYFGFTPKIVGIRSWSTRRRGQEKEVRQDAMSWHIDLDFNNHIKVFVFTSDVDSSLGDHQYVNQTHDTFMPPLLSKTGGVLQRYTTQQLLDNNLHISNLSPKRGQIVIANTRCLHRGTPVSSNRERLIYEITFADSPVGLIRMPLEMYLSTNNLK